MTIIHERKTKRGLARELTEIGYKFRDLKKVANNTFSFYLENGIKIVRFWDTNIYEEYPCGRKLFTNGGYDTVTTRARLNMLAPSWLGFSTKQGIPLVFDTRNGRHAHDYQRTVLIGPRGGLKIDPKGLWTIRGDFLAYTKRFVVFFEDDRACIIPHKYLYNDGPDHAKTLAPLYSEALLLNINKLNVEQDYSRLDTLIGKFYKPEKREIKL